MSFAKLDGRIVSSSLWSEELHIRVVFVTMLALKDESGFVSGSPTSTARICNVSKEQFLDAERVLSSPDDESQDKEFDGRRIAKIDGGWIVLNHEKYRIREDEKKKKRNEYMKNYMASVRANEKGVNTNKVNSELTRVNGELTQSNSGLTSVSVSVSESNSVSDLEKGCGEKRFLTDSVFETFWRIYPRKEDMDASKQKFNQVIETKLVTEYQIMDAVARYNSYCMLTYDDYPHSRYIKKAKNWLTDSGWKEDWLKLARQIVRSPGRPNRDEIKQTITDIPMMEL